MNLLLSILIFLLPAIIGNFPLLFCTMDKEAGQNVKFRPPPIVFSIIWPILYIFMGLTFVLFINEQYKNNLLSNINLICYLLLFTSLALWLVFYSCWKDKKNAIYIIFLSIMFSLLCITMTTNIYAKILLIPLVVWLLLASTLNMNEVLNQSES
jgi:tryptophan-rich sensory protein